MKIETTQLEDGLRYFAEAIEQTPALRAEFDASRSGFFTLRAEQPADPDERRRADRRHLEWFLFERTSVELGGLPAQELLPAWRVRAESEQPALLEREQAWLATHCSIFEVTSVEEGVGAWLQDLAGLGEFVVDDPRGSRAYTTGDLIVGRLYPTDAVHFTVSPAAGFYRDATLLEAMRKDLGQHREHGDKNLLRLAQDELERMFWAASKDASSDAPTQDPVGDTHRFFAESGIDSRTIEGLLERLAATSFDAEAVAHGGADVLGEVLDALAFDTNIDLELARGHLSKAWAALAGPQASRPDPREQAAEPELDPLTALEEFDSDRGRGLGVDESFAELERRLGLDALEDPEEDVPAPDFPGAVAAMIEEFLWERTNEGKPDEPAAAGQLRQLGRFAEPVGVFENLSERDLLVFASWWVLEHDVLADKGDALRFLDVLEAFCRWAEEAHEVPLLTDFGPRVTALRESLPRAVHAKHRHAREAGEDTGELYEFLNAAGDGRARVRDRSGDEPSLELGPLADELAEGDLLRARRGDDDTLAVYCVYPPEAAGLAAGLSGRE